MHTASKGYLSLLMYSLLAGAIGVAFKLIDNMDVFSVSFIRAFTGVLVIFLVLVWKKGIRTLKLVYPWKTLFVGVFQGISILLFFSALQYTTVANVIFLLYTAPIFSLIFSRLFLKETIRKESIIGVVLVVVGIFILLDPRSLRFTSATAIGNVLALLSGMFYSAMAIVAKPISKKRSGYYLSFWAFLVISIAFLPFIIGIPLQLIFHNVYPLLYLGVLGTGVAFILFMTGVKFVPAQKVFIVTSIEPLAATLLAVLILSEIPSLFTLVGGLFILSGVWVITHHVKK